MIASFTSFAQTTYLNPLQGVPCAEASDSYEAISSKIDSLIQAQNDPPLGELTNRADRLYWGISNNPAIITDTALLESYCSKYGSARYQYFYINVSQGKIPDCLICNNGAYNYYLFDYGNFTELPNLAVGNRIRYIYMRYSANVPSTIPTSWANGTFLQRLYFQRCGYSTSQVDNVIIILSNPDST